jgi:hypothetical protein
MVSFESISEKFSAAAKGVGAAISYCRKKSDAFMTGTVMTGYVGTCAAAGTCYGMDRAIETGASPLVTSFYAVAGAVVTAAMAYGGCKIAEWREGNGERIITPGIQRSMAIGVASATMYAANSYLQFA